jgi:hypothetical protein
MTPPAQRIVLQKPLLWGQRAVELKALRSQWSTKKKAVDEKLTKRKHVVDILKWVRRDDDPEIGLDALKRKITPDGRYIDCAKWFLESREFQAWSQGFQTLRDPDLEFRPVLWIRGPYGTGKTTLMYVINVRRMDFLIGVQVSRCLPSEGASCEWTARETSSSDRIFLQRQQHRNPASGS